MRGPHGRGGFFGGNPFQKVAFRPHFLNLLRLLPEKPCEGTGGILSGGSRPLGQEVASACRPCPRPQNLFLAEIDAGEMVNLVANDGAELEPGKSLLPVAEEGTEGTWGHADAGFFRGMEVGWLEDAQVEEADGKTVNNRSTKDFYHVEGEAGMAIGFAVKETHPRIKASGVEGREQGVGKQGVAEGEEGVGWVGGRAFAAAWKGDSASG